MVVFCGWFSCQTYEGGFGGCPGMEAHGGYSFCGLAALVLVGKEHLCDMQALLVRLFLLTFCMHVICLCICEHLFHFECCVSFDSFSSLGAITL